MYIRRGYKNWWRNCIYDDIIGVFDEKKLDFVEEMKMEIVAFKGDMQQQADCFLENVLRLLGYRIRLKIDI